MRQGRNKQARELVLTATADRTCQESGPEP